MSRKFKHIPYAGSPIKKWLTPIKLTKLGEKQFPRLRNRKAFFVGYSRSGSYIILIEENSVTSAYAKELWKKITP